MRLIAWEPPGTTAHSEAARATPESALLLFTSRGSNSLPVSRSCRPLRSLVKVGQPKANEGRAAMGRHHIELNSARTQKGVSKNYAIACWIGIGLVGRRLWRSVKGHEFFHDSEMAAHKCRWFGRRERQTGWQQRDVSRSGRRRTGNAGKSRMLRLRT